MESKLLGLLLVTWKKIWPIGDWRISSNDRVVKSSWLLAKIIAYLVSISQATLFSISFTDGIFCLKYHWTGRFL